MTKFIPGKRVEFPNAEKSKGTIVENFKLPGDICIKWDECTTPYSYDEEFLIEHGVKVIEDSKEVKS